MSVKRMELSMGQAGMRKIGAIGGIAFVVLQMAAQGLIQVGGLEPTFGAPATDIVAFFQARDARLVNLGDYLTALSSIAFLWFIGALWHEMRRVEREPGVLSMVAAGSGLIAVAVISAGSGWPLAVFRVEAGLEPQLARYLFDQGNYAFATMWVFAASLMLAAGLAGLRYGLLPGWISWLGLVAAAGLLAVRFIWASPSGVVFLPYMLFWLWLIAVGVVFLRRPAPASAD
jgi:hypothetical protein